LRTSLIVSLSTLEPRDDDMEPETEPGDGLRSLGPATPAGLAAAYAVAAVAPAVVRCRYAFQAE
jgi:hypothetical protein